MIVIKRKKITEKGEKGNLRFYRTSSGTNSFDYIEDYEIKGSIEYIGGKETNLKSEKMIISNQGGLIELSAIIDNLGKITYSENDNISTLIVIVLNFRIGTKLRVFSQ